MSEAELMKNIIMKQEVQKKTYLQDSKILCTVSTNQFTLKILLYPLEIKENEKYGCINNINKNSAIY